MTDAKPDLLALAARAKELAEKATPGPWVWQDWGQDDGPNTTTLAAPPEGGRNERFPTLGHSILCDEDAGCLPDDKAFIAFARTALPALAEGVVELTAKLDAAAQQIYDSIPKWQANDIQRRLDAAEAAREEAEREVEKYFEAYGLACKAVTAAETRLAEVERALEYAFGAAKNELVARGLPLEWSPNSGLGVMEKALAECKRDAARKRTATKES